MVAYKFVFLALGVIGMTSTASGASISRVHLANPLTKRECNLECHGPLEDCESRCNDSKVNKVLVSVCYKNTCYCGYSP
ncbi:hypothetical protein BCR42DRAFT_410078 [Absidia repens]|uniref:Invertebrate defensins family profile domain-containing protein n=1 Tax=Absidia repens TaxID=90262 RepID=A0A1X2INL5_9FUNG|nr:hypothetical protein BCR42DRAFT_410078 [Absidia repens]